MPFAFVQAHPLEITADAIFLYGTPAQNRYIPYYGIPQNPWPTLHIESCPEQPNPQHPIFCGLRLPSEPQSAKELMWGFSTESRHTFDMYMRVETTASPPSLCLCLQNAVRAASLLGCQSAVFSLPDTCFATGEAGELARKTAAVLSELPTDLLLLFAISPENKAQLRKSQAAFYQRLENIFSLSQLSYGKNIRYYSDETPKNLPQKGLWVCEPPSTPSYQAQPMGFPGSQKLHRLLQELSQQETFQQMLFRLIDEKQYKDSFVYKKANLDRRLFSKIRSHPDYHPSKNTVLALAIALQLDIDTTQELLQKAGFLLSPALRRDQIIEFFIREKFYDIFHINEALFYFSLPLLGSTEAEPFPTHLPLP